MFILSLDFWIYFFAPLNFILSLWGAIHVVLYKRDSRSAISWIVIISVLPFVGVFFYFCFGINRIRRRAHFLRDKQHWPEKASNAIASKNACTEMELVQWLTPEKAYFKSLKTLLDHITQEPLQKGNRIQPLFQGDQAFPEMLAAIESAKYSIALCTYIFDEDSIGSLFVDALERAVKRGVSVCVLVDAVGARYSPISIVKVLRKRGVSAHKFLPTLFPRSIHYSNLRNHRKILVIDGKIGFTGGMNIREERSFSKITHEYRSLSDIHFRLEGPVVTELQETFAIDWAFTTQEMLAGERWFPELSPVGDSFARGITDGPDEDFEKFRLTLLGALAIAQESIWIMTPYFLPDASLISALNIASLRGVEVHILLPEKNNLFIVQWASTALFWQLLERNCKIWLTPPPFDHSKIFLIDDIWILLGSANWDPRSLRLNFEFNVECYDRSLAKILGDYLRNKLHHSKFITLEEVDRRKFLIRLRDGIARLFSPFL